MPDYSIVALFCEDVRVEQNSQNTVIGVLPDNVNVKQIPGSFVRMALYIRSHFNLNFKLESLAFELVQPDGKVINSIAVESATIAKSYSDANNINHPVAGLISAMIMSPLRIEAAGQYKVIAKVNDEAFVCGALNVKVAESASKD